MTDEAKRCIAALRVRCRERDSCNGCAKDDYCHYHGEEALHDFAADLIESFSAELEQVKQERDGLNILLGQAQSTLETRTRERDAAVEDIYSMKACALCKHYPNGEQCETYFLLCCECDMGNCICKECVNGEKMQWRGIQEEV